MTPRRALLLLLACGALLSPGLAVLAQDGASLPWWTADGGGVTSLTGSGYTLGGTAGQPDAGRLEGSGFTLRGGFWQAFCTAAAVTPAIERAGSSVTLDWLHDPANRAYQVHRGLTPYFTPAGATLREVISAAPWSYTDPEVVIGDPDTNHFYLVRAACPTDHADPARQGEFDFRLTPGGR